MKEKQTFIKEGDIVVYKSFWGKKVMIVNKVFKDSALIDDYLWYEDKNKVRYCKIVKLDKLYK